MFRKLVMLISLAIIGAGLWIIKTEHAKDAACSVHSGHTTSPSFNASCSSIITAYFAGFAIALAGSLIFIFTIAVMKRRRRR